PLAAAQALIPAVQLGVLMIVSASVTDRKDRQHDSANDGGCIPEGILHFTPSMPGSRPATGPRGALLHACPMRMVPARGTRTSGDRLQRLADRCPLICNVRSGRS